MTQQEIENELEGLRKQEEARKKNWRSIRKTAIYPNSRHETLQMAIMFIMLSLPMSLLASALR